MSIVITYRGTAGFDGTTRTDTTSAYARAPDTDDKNGYVGDTGPAGGGLDPIGVVRPRFAAETIENQLKTGNVPLRLIRTSAALEPVNAVTIDDFLAWSVEVLSAIPMADLVVEVVNVLTGSPVKTIPMVDSGTGNLFVSSECALVPTMHALRFTGTATDLQVTLVLEPVDNPRDFAQLCTANAIGDQSSTSSPQLFLLQNVAAVGPLVLPPGGVPFTWDSPPLIDDAGDWTRLNPTDVQCNRPGRYEVRYSMAWNVGAVPGYVAAFADLDALYLDASLSQFDVQDNQAATFLMPFVLPSVASGQILRVLVASSPAVSWSAGAGAQLSIKRLR